MRFSNESAFTRWVCDEIRHVNGVVTAFVASEMQAAGIPDRYVCHRTWRGWVEVKITTPTHAGAPSALQRKFLRDHAERGDNAVVLRLDARASRVQVEDADGSLLAGVPLAAIVDAPRPGLKILELLRSAT